MDNLQRSTLDFAGRGPSQGLFKFFQDLDGDETAGHFPPMKLGIDTAHREKMICLTADLSQERENQRQRRTGTTPIDLDDNAFDFQFYLAAGYRLEQLLTI